nr:MAK10-like protein [Tanacetum cinerariifolium]
MGDKNHICTLGYYSRTSHEGYRNTIELLEGNNVAILEDLTLYDNESWNDPRDFSKPVKAIALPQDVSSTSDRHLIELENQVQRLMEAHLTLTRPTHVNKITTPCEICSGHHDTQNCMEIPKQAFVDYASSHINKMGSKRNAGIPMVPKSIVAISHDEREELKKKGIKSPSKLLSPQYLSPASIKELNKNPSALNRVLFVNSIVILSTESDTDEDDTSSTSIHKHKLDDMVKGSKEIKEQSKEEDGIETDMEVEEVIEEEERIITSRMAVEASPTPVGKGKIALSIATLEKCEENGTVMFKQGDEKITFRMPYTMETFKQTRFMGFSIDSIPPFAYEENFGLEKMHYYQSLLIGDEYKHDDGGRRGIRHLMRLEKEMMNNKGELT